MGQVNEIGGFVRIADWVRSRPTLFRSMDSWRWFARQNRTALQESGQYIVRMGACGSLAGPGLDRVVAEIIRKRQQK